MKQGTSFPDSKKVVTIPKEKAVFWMDGLGCWHNQHGPFEHRRLIAYFNASIRRDREGYFVSQTRGEIIEKVYFKYEVTALFITDILSCPTDQLLLNTGSRLNLVPDALYIYEDQLFMDHQQETIKFTPRAMMKLSEQIDEVHGIYGLTLDGKRYEMPVREPYSNYSSP